MASIDQWIKRHLRADAPHARSLIVTLFGDSVAPYSDGVWLSDLIELLAPFGANERLVRTSVFRLTEDNWLTAAREGRRSYYTLAPGGRRRFQHAYHRVYTPPGDWDGKWTVVAVPKNGAAADRARLREELEWEGYAAIGSGVFARPGADPQSLRETLDELELGQKVVVLVGGKAEGASPVSELIQQGWDLGPVVRRYRTFLGRFRPLLSSIDQGASLTGERAFVVQTLLIDSFRRITLHDPRLPVSLLPADWPGSTAYELCRHLYRRTHRLVRNHVLPRFTDENSSAQVPAEILRRFGGL
jgi:phenylacetic acid degradation operon negative regulatory protein